MARRKDCYTDEEKARIITHVLAEVASGRSVASILEEDEGLCSNTCFWRWHFEDEELRGNLALARDNGVEARLEEALRIADTPMLGTIETDKMVSGGEGGPVPFTEIKREDMLAHRKLQVETRFKLAQMLKPKTYGAKLDVTSGGKQLMDPNVLAAANERAKRYRTSEEANHDDEDKLE